MTDTTRRDVLASLAVMVAGLWLPGGPAADLASGGEGDGWLSVCMPDMAAAGRLGRAYLAAHPAELDPRRLVAELRESLQLGAGGEAIDTDAAAELIIRVREVVTQDYLAGRVVPVDGWVLSLTEARLYALAALADGDLR